VPLFPAHETKSYAARAFDIAWERVKALARMLQRRIGRKSSPGRLRRLFALDVRKYAAGARPPALTASVQAQARFPRSTRHHRPGLVNHCVNDIASWALSALLPDYSARQVGAARVPDIIGGFAKALRRKSLAALIGGETAQMRRFYRAGEY